MAPRVLILDENLSVPFDRRVWNESRALTEAGYEVTVICPRGEGRDVEPYVEIEGIRIHRFPGEQATDGVGGYLREYAIALRHMIPQAIRLGWKRPFDVVHACNPPDLLFLVALPLKLRGARFVFDAHDLVPELLEVRFKGRKPVLRAIVLLLERITFALADGVIATNETYRGIAQKRGKIPPDQLTVVRNGPDPSYMRRVDPDPELKRGKPYLLGFVGVMGFADGVDYGVRAMAHLRHDMGRTDFHATFIGAGDAFESCRQLAHDLELDDCVEFTGRLPDEDVRRYLSTADIALSTDPKNALNDISTMGKVLEYMAMGLPIVGFDLKEARVSAGDASLYARNNDEREFARLVAQLMDDSEQRSRMGEIGRRRIEERLGWEFSKRHLVDFYDQLTGTSRPSPAEARPEPEALGA